MWLFGKREPEDNLGVFEIPWKNYTHAYGEATDVPRQLLDLQNENSKVRESAIWQLFGNIYHQGTVYEASQYAVPFLIKLISNPELPDRESILVLLAYLADGTSFHDVHSRFLTELDDVPENLDQIIAEELDYVQRCRDAVIDGMPVFEGLLNDDKPEIRIAVSYVFSVLGKDAACQCEAFMDRLVTENDDAVLASYLLTLPVLGVKQSLLDELRSSLSNRNGDLVSLALALLEMRITGKTAKEESIDLAMQTLVKPPAIAHEISYETWCEGGVQELVVSYLSMVGRERLRKKLDGLIMLLVSNQRFSSETLVRTVLYVAFGEDRYSGRPDELTPDQKRVIVALFDCNRVIMRDIGPDTYFSNNCEILREFGIPTDEEELETLAGVCR